MKVIVGGIIEKEGKYLLVQEAKKKCYEKWNFPAGHLDFNESLKQGAIREIKEETGCDNMKVIATGGLGKMIAQTVDEIDYYDSTLTLKGLQIIYEKQ